MKGGINLAGNGYIQVHTYTGNARIPLDGASIAITDPAGTPIAFRLTNRSGTLNEPVEIAVPDLAYSQSPNSGMIPYATVNLYARAENYELIEIKNLQVFADTITAQNLQMIPLSELPDSFLTSELFQTTPQNL